MLGSTSMTGFYEPGRGGVCVGGVFRRPLPRGPGSCRRAWRVGHGRAAAALSRPHPGRLTTFPTPVRPWGLEGGVEAGSSRGPTRRPLPDRPVIPPSTPASSLGKPWRPQAGRWAGGAKGRPPAPGRSLPLAGPPLPAAALKEGGAGPPGSVSASGTGHAAGGSGAEGTRGRGLGWRGVPGTRSRESTFRPPLGRSSGRREGRGLRPERRPPSFPWDARRRDCAGVGRAGPSLGRGEGSPLPHYGNCPAGPLAFCVRACVPALPRPASRNLSRRARSQEATWVSAREPQSRRSDSLAGRPDMDLGRGVGLGSNPAGGGNSPRPGRRNGGNRGVV